MRKTSKIVCINEIFVCIEAAAQHLQFYTKTDLVSKYPFGTTH